MNFNCNFNTDVDKIASRIAENHYKCKKKIFDSKDDISTKKVKFEDCVYKMYREIDAETKDSALRKIIKSKKGRTIFLRNKKFLKLE